MASTTTYAVRPAKREDCAEIARLIQELSDYEQLLDAPKIDPKALYLKIRYILYNNPIKHFCLKYKESYFYQ